MSVGPLRRSIGALGLLALVPVAGMMLLGTLTPVDAAQRAMTITVALLMIGRLVGWGIGYLARSVEEESPGEPRPAGEAAGVSGRSADGGHA